MNQLTLKVKRYNEILDMIKLFFVFLGGTIFLFTIALLVEAIA